MKKVCLFGINPDWYTDTPRTVLGHSSDSAQTMLGQSIDRNPEKEANVRQVETPRRQFLSIMVLSKFNFTGQQEF